MTSNVNTDIVLQEKQISDLSDNKMLCHVLKWILKIETGWKLSKAAFSWSPVGKRNAFQCKCWSKKQTKTKHAKLLWKQEGLWFLSQ